MNAVIALKIRFTQHEELWLAFGCVLGLSLASQAQRITDVYTFAQTPQDLSAAEGQLRGTGESALEVVIEAVNNLVLRRFRQRFRRQQRYWRVTSEDTGEGLIWQAVDVAGNGYYVDGSACVQPPAGEFSTNIGSINSTTADNGWMVFDCDYFNTSISEDTKTQKAGLPPL